MKIPTMPVSLTEIGFVLSIMFLVTFLMALVHSNDNLEKNLPPVDLIQTAIHNDSGVTADDLTIITIAKGENNIPCIFFGNKEIDFKALGKIIDSENPNEISLRVDNDVSHGQVMKVILTCKAHGVRRISFSYEEVEKIKDK